jgi:hypothetical protein
MATSTGDYGVTQESLAEEFPDRETWRGFGKRWCARLRGAEPPIIVCDDHLDGLREEIIRMVARLEARAEAERRRSSQ